MNEKLSKITVDKDLEVLLMEKVVSVVMSKDMRTIYRKEHHTYVTLVQTVCQTYEMRTTNATHESDKQHIWTGHFARRPMSSWVWRVTDWRDSEWQALAMNGGSSRPLRPSRRRWLKWENVLHRFCSQGGLGSWKALAQNRETWADHRNDFLRWCSEPLGIE